ncbi:MAG: hypothetical protein AAF582_10415, partial [Pseudomonadota bacterium]
ATLQYRALLSEMRASADRLCEERGGLEVSQPIPEWMDVVTVFMDAGGYRTVPGPVDPHPHFGGAHNYLLIEHVPKEQLASHTRPNTVTAYTTGAHYLSTGRIGAVEFLIEDFQHYDNSPRPDLLHDGRLLPDRDLPNGMYRYALSAVGDPACANFDEMIAAFKAQQDRSGYQPQNEFDDAVVANGQCIAIFYVGPKETYVPPGFIYHKYRDDLPEYQVRQYVDALLDPSGQLIAKRRHFSAATRSGYCGDGSRIFKHFVYSKLEP